MKPIEQARADLNAEKASGEHDAILANLERVIDIAMRLKKSMIAHGKTVAKAVCPECKVSGALHGRLVGRKNHLHMWCDNCPDIRMME